MTLRKAYRTIVLIAAGVLCMANSECDEDYNCSAACSHLASCEDKWLADEGALRMSSDEYLRYTAACRNHCGAKGSYDEIECVQATSCDQLLDGKCSE